MSRAWLALVVWACAACVEARANITATDLCDLGSQVLATLPATDPGYADARLQVGVCYFQAGEWLHARATLAGVDLPKARLMDAMALQELGRYRDSLRALDAIEARDGGSNPLIEFYRARAYTMMGDGEHARAALDRARALDTDEQLDVPIAELDQMLAARPPLRTAARPDRYASASAGLGYTDNIDYGADGKDDGYLRLRIGGGLRIAESALGDTFAEGYATTTQPFDHRDQQEVIAGAALRQYSGFAIGGAAVRVDAGLEYTNLNVDRNSYGDIYSVQLGFVTPARPGLDWGARLRSDYNDYHFDVPAAESPDGWLHQIYATMGWQLPVMYGVFSVNGSIGYQVDRSELQNDGWVFSLGADYPLRRRLHLFGSISLNNRDYSSLSVREVIATQRSDETWTTRLGIGYALSRRANVTLEWLRVDQSSNVSDASYQRNDILLTVGVEY